MLYEIMRYLRNFFPGECISGDITIEDGTVSLSLVGKYVLIEGSKYNDGVHELPLKDLEDEAFKGSITALRPPKEFLSLVDEIEAFQGKYEATGYTSESFGGYSYTKATNTAGVQVGWQDVFRDRLKVWRKM